VKTYLEISITATNSQRELLIPTMIELGCRSFQETETELLCYFEEKDSPAKPPNKQRSRKNAGKQQINGLKDKIARMVRMISANADVRYRTIEEKKWNEEWERTIKPIEIGEKIVIKPSWAQYENKQNRIVIQIDPKMSFGTGYHETTRLVIRLLEQYTTPECSVLDVGTGTGILAIAAVKLGAQSAVAIDNDKWSIENAQENVLANAVSDKVTITTQPINELTNNQSHLIAANITLNTIIELLPEMVKRLKEKGILLLSGLLRDDEAALTAALSTYGFRVAEKISENEWIAVAAQPDVE
jgi:ribosomal protein L11 methyltransferase